MTRFFLGIFILLCLSAGSAAAQGRTVPQTAKQIQLSFSPLVKKVAPAVVNIYTKRTVTQHVSPFMGDPFFEQFFGRGFGFGGGLSRQRVESALGSGVIVKQNGLIVTNAHVIDGAEEIKVVLMDGREYEAEKLLVDERSDLALLQAVTEGDELPFAELQPSESLEVGDLVLAIGNSFGVGQTVTSGIVSALARSSLPISDFNFFIQTDAAINPGNSGGPLVAVDGGIVGINSAIFSRDGGSQGIGFAIPSELVMSVIAAAENGETGDDGIARPWLGITAQQVTQDIAENIGLELPRGVLIAGFHEASPARAGGLEIGDVVVAVNGHEVFDPSDMKFRMATIPLGSEAEFRVYRDGRERGVSVEAIRPPEDPPRDERVLSGRHVLDGVTVANINPSLMTEYGLSEKEGVIVLEIRPRMQAMRIVQPGDLVLSVNETEIRTTKELEEIMNRAGSGAASFVIKRNGQTRQVVVR